MQIKLSFLGASRNVTGSQYLLEANGMRLLVDCGMYQERKFKYRNWEPFKFSADSIDAVLLTHAHLDHCGLLPKLVNEGFSGNIYCTAATAEIAQIIILDSAKLQEEDAEFKQKRHQRESRSGPYPEVPLYTIEDAEAVAPLFSPVKYEEAIEVGDGIKVCFHDAGHVLGSSIIEVVVSQDGEERSVVFSGDVGARNKPIIRDRIAFEEADYILVESTYGDRLRTDKDNVAEDLAEVINSTQRAGGNIVVPSFALERTQELLYYMNELLRENKIPHIMVFVDSPMANRITEVFLHYPELYDEEMRELIRQKKSPFQFPGLNMTQTVDESKAINHVRGTIMIIAGSGMANGGRVKHHLVTNISRKESTILFVGYQAAGTLGRSIVDGARKVRILGQHYPVRARIAQIHGFSAHADRDGLFRWLSGLKKPPRHVFITHGEEESAQNFANYLRDKTGWQVSVPYYGEEVLLD
ncbi:MBL fold metallo-hydrolase RNA specificity domain-containing protein [Chloroflexota bacterium]